MGKKDKQERQTERGREKGREEGIKGEEYDPLKDEYDPSKIDCLIHTREKSEEREKGRATNH